MTAPYVFSNQDGRSHYITAPDGSRRRVNPVTGVPIARPGKAAKKAAKRARRRARQQGAVRS
jgi:hypothetical protein